MHLLKIFFYSKLSLNNLESASSCVCKTFVLNEPLTQHLQMTEEMVRPFFHQLLIHALEDQLSWVAIDEETENVVGACILTDFANDYCPNSIFDPKMMDTLRFFENLWRPFVDETSVKKGYLVHGYVAAVFPEYQRQGVLSHLSKVSFEHGWKRGYRKVMGEATSQYSLNFFRKSPNLEELHSIAYSDYEVDGKKIFSGMKIHERCTLFSLSYDDNVA